MQRKAVAVVAWSWQSYMPGFWGWEPICNTKAAVCLTKCGPAKRGERWNRQTAWRSEQLKWCGGALGYLAVATGVWLVLAKRMKAREYGVSVGSALILGVLATLPWWLKSGDNAGDYYVQQLFLVLAGMGGGVIAALSRAAGDRQELS